MICFKDMTFCNSPVCKGECGRQWTPELEEEAQRWWGGPGAPVAFADYCSPKLENHEKEKRGSMAESKYYHVMYIRQPSYGGTFTEASVIDEHPFIWLKRMKEVEGHRYTLLSWQEITKEEYMLFFKPIEDIE